MKEIKLFLALNEEPLNEEKKAIEDLTRRLNEQCAGGGICLKTVTEWTALAEAETDGGLYVFIFFKECGEPFFARFEELLLAQKENGTPRIAVYFKTAAGTRPTKELKSLRERLDNEQGCFCGEYAGEDELKFYVLMQICALSEEPIVNCRDGVVTVNEAELLPLGTIPAARNNKDLIRLRGEYREAEGEYRVARKAYDESETDETRLLLQSAVKNKSGLRDEIEAIERGIITVSLNMAKMAAKGDASAREREVCRLFQKGDYKGVNAALSFSKIADDIKAREKANDRAGLQASVNELILRADILRAVALTPESIAELERSLDEAARLEEAFDLPRNALYSRLVAQEEAQEYKQAEETAEQLLKYYGEKKDASDEYRRAACLTLLACAQKKLLKDERCERTCADALISIAPLAAKEPKKFYGLRLRLLGFLCEISYNKANYDAALGYSAAAVRNIDESAKRLADYEIRALLQAARLCKDVKKFEEAVKLLDLATDAVNVLFKENEAKYAAIYLDTLVTRGELYLAMLDYARAHRLFDAAKTVYAIYCFSCDKDLLYYRALMGLARAEIGCDADHEAAARLSNNAIEYIAERFNESPAAYAAYYLEAATLNAAAQKDLEGGSDARLREVFKKTEARLDADNLRQRVIKARALSVLADYAARRENFKKESEYRAAARELTAEAGALIYIGDSAKIAFSQVKASKKHLSEKRLSEMTKKLETVLNAYEHPTKDETFNKALNRYTCYDKARYYAQTARLRRLCGDADGAYKLLCKVIERLGEKEIFEDDSAFRRSVYVDLFSESAECLIAAGDLEGAGVCSDTAMDAEETIAKKARSAREENKLINIYLTRAELIETEADAEERFYKLAEARAARYEETGLSRKTEAGSPEEEGLALFCDIEESFGDFLSRNGRAGEGIEKYNCGLAAARRLASNGSYRGYMRAARLHYALAKRYIESGEYDSADASLKAAAGFIYDKKAVGEESARIFEGEGLKYLHARADLKSKLGYIEEAKRLYEAAIEIVARVDALSEARMKDEGLKYTDILDSSYLKQKGLLYLGAAEHLARHTEDKKGIAKNKRLARAAFALGARVATDGAQREEFRDMVFDLDHPKGE